MEARTSFSSTVRRISALIFVEPHLLQCRRIAYTPVLKLQISVAIHFN